MSWLGRVDLAVLVLVGAGVAASALVILRLRRRIRRLEADALTDPLTGTFNRRHLDAALAASIQRRDRAGEPAALLVLDVDHFKAINDRLGHAGGDRVLVAIAALVTRHARRIDALFRIGGDEFLLLVAGAGHDDALRVAERVRVDVERHVEAPGGPVTVSIGVSDLGDRDSPARWLARADAALYGAKRAGRNRIGGSPTGPARWPGRESGRFLSA